MIPIHPVWLRGYDIFSVNEMCNCVLLCGGIRFNHNETAMKTENRDSEKDLNANPDSRLNTNKPISKPERFPESHQAQDEMERVEREERRAKERRGKDDSNIELLADEVQGSVSSRETSNSPEDIAGVSDLDRGMRRAKRR